MKTGYAVVFPQGHVPDRLLFAEHDGESYIMEFSGHTEDRRYAQLYQEGVSFSQYPQAAFERLQLP